ncbi:hypothetical protein DLH72_00245 [Candidatus Gracilibacteria bacterium]|nr:MAG: hypothetical protein DLH72_00245 [Candidatus Gracilibacteria bacterium]
MNKFFTIVKKEFFKNIKKPSFWILTFGLPLIYVVVFGVVFFSNLQTQETLKKKNDIIKNIYIYDESGIINKDSSSKNILLVHDYETGYNNFLGAQENIFIHYKKDFLETKKIDLFVNSKDFIDSYNGIVDEITKNSILDKIKEKNLTIAYSSDFLTNIKKYKDGQEVLDLSNKTIVAGIGAFVFFFMMIFGNTLMLTSTSQEKENRVVEIILSTVSTKIFILGKIFGGLCVLIFQLFIFLLFPLLTVLFFRESIPIDVLETLSKVSLLDWFFMLFYIIGGFLIFAGLMVAVGSLGANSKQAGQLSTPFTLLSVLPLYLASALMANPTGYLALFFSYFPFTSSMVLLYRTGASELLAYEKIIGPIITLIFIFISFYFAKKSFEIGVLEYNKLSLKNIFKRNNSKK